MRILTWNIHRAIGLDGATDIDRVAQQVRAVGADVACLQEVPSYRWMMSDLCPRRRLAKPSGMYERFGTTIPSRVRGFGHSIMTCKKPLHSYGLDGSLFGPRGVTAVTIPLDNQEVHVICIHLGLSAEMRELEVKRIVDLIDPFDGPLIIAGDFNERPHEAAVSWLKGRMSLEDACPEGPATFMAPQPTERIDLILVSKHWRVNSCEVIETNASDHFAVVADVELTG